MSSKDGYHPVVSITQIYKISIILEFSIITILRANVRRLEEFLYMYSNNNLYMLRTRIVVRSKNGNTI